MTTATASTISAILESAQFTFVGRAARAAEAKYLQDGKVVAKVRIAINPGKDLEPHWFTVEAWDHLAEQLVDGCDKGSLVEVLGRVTTNNWTTKTGEQRTDLIIKASAISLLANSGAKRQAATKEEMPF